MSWAQLQQAWGELWRTTVEERARLEAARRDGRTAAPESARGSAGGPACGAAFEPAAVDTTAAADAMPWLIRVATGTVPAGDAPLRPGPLEAPFPDVCAWTCDGAAFGGDAARIGPLSTTGTPHVVLHRDWLSLAGFAPTGEFAAYVGRGIVVLTVRGGMPGVVRH